MQEMISNNDNRTDIDNNKALEVVDKLLNTNSSYRRVLNVLAGVPMLLLMEDTPSGAKSIGRYTASHKYAKLPAMTDSTTDIQLIDVETPPLDRPEQMATMLVDSKMKDSFSEGS